MRETRYARRRSPLLLLVFPTLLVLLPLQLLAPALASAAEPAHHRPRATRQESWRSGTRFETLGNELELRHGRYARRIPEAEAGGEDRERETRYIRRMAKDGLGGEVREGEVKDEEGQEPEEEVREGWELEGERLSVEERGGERVPRTGGRRSRDRKHRRRTRGIGDAEGLSLGSHSLASQRGKRSMLSGDLGQTSGALASSKGALHLASGGLTSSNVALGEASGALTSSKGALGEASGAQASAGGAVGRDKGGKKRHRHMAVRVVKVFVPWGQTGRGRGRGKAKRLSLGRQRSSIKNIASITERAAAGAAQGASPAVNSGGPTGVPEKAEEDAAAAGSSDGNDGSPSPLTFSAGEVEMSLKRSPEGSLGDPSDSSQLGGAGSSHKGTLGQAAGSLEESSGEPLNMALWRDKAKAKGRGSSGGSRHAGGKAPPKYRYEASAPLHLKRISSLLGIPFGSPQHDLWRVIQATKQARMYQAMGFMNSAMVIRKTSAVFNASGLTLPYGVYYITLGLGTPTQMLNVQFDTGSGTFWVSCNCISCMNTKMAVPFEPSNSSTVKSVRCSDAPCMEATGALYSCSSQDCHFSILYGDGSSTSGPVLVDVLSMPNLDAAADTIQGYAHFGCSDTQSGILLPSELPVTGIMGIGPQASSVPGQLSAQGILPQAFSFCLDSRVENGSHLLLGRGPQPADMRTTPLLGDLATSSYYFIGVEDIRIGSGVVQASVGMGKQGVILDTGTQVTLLPPDIFSGIIAEVERQSNAQFALHISNGLTCTQVTEKGLQIFPDLVMNTGTADWVVRPSNYLSFTIDSWGTFLFCFQVLPVSDLSTEFTTIIGEPWLNDHFVFIDVDKAIVGWAPLNCSSGEYFGLVGESAPPQQQVPPQGPSSPSPASRSAAPPPPPPPPPSPPKASPEYPSSPDSPVSPQFPDSPQSPQSPQFSESPPETPEAPSNPSAILPPAGFSPDEPFLESPPPPSRPPPLPPSPPPPLLPSPPPQLPLPSPPPEELPPPVAPPPTSPGVPTTKPSSQLTVTCNSASSWSSGGATITQYSCHLSNSGSYGVTRVKLACPGYAPLQQWNIGADCAVPGVVYPGQAVEFGFQTSGNSTPEFSVSSFSPSSGSVTVAPSSAGPALSLSCSSSGNGWWEGSNFIYQYSCTVQNVGFVTLGNVHLSCSGFEVMRCWNIDEGCALPQFAVLGAGGTWGFGFQTTSSSPTLSISSYSSL